MLAVLTGVFAATEAKTVAESSRSQAPITLAQAASKTIYCYDEARSVVTRKEQWRCEGTVISAEEAERIRQERIRRIQGVLTSEKDPLVPGKRLLGTGTGFYITTDGHVLTNNHVIAECKAVSVTPVGQPERVATVLGADAKRDLALLDTGQPWPNAARFINAWNPNLGLSTTVVGYPLHGKVVIKPRMVVGHLDAEKQPNNPYVFRMKIDIRRGNSGGPVLDAAGRVVGVVFAKLDTPALFEKTGELVKDIGFGIQLRVVRDFLRLFSINVSTTNEAVPLDPDARFERAREFVVQVGCWR